MIPSFKTSREDALLIHKIAKRAVGLVPGTDMFDMSMDITVAHANGCPLRLAELLAADDGNFGHDVFGIRRFIDRETGKLGDCFLPRYCASQAQEGPLE